MTFENIEKRAGRYPKTPVSISCMHLGKERFVFAVRLRPDIMNTLGMQLGKRVTAERGIGKDAKWLRMTPSDLSGFKIVKSGHRSCSGYIYLQALADKRKHLAAPAVHKVIDDVLYIELPKWARAKSAKAT